MAPPTVKEILLKWNIDNTNWKQAINDLARLLEQQAAKAQKAQDQGAAKLQAQKDKLKEYIADQKSATAELEKQIQVMKLSAAAALTAKNESLAKLAAEKAATAELQKQQAQEKLGVAQQQQAKLVAQEKLAAEKAASAETMKQAAEQKVLQAQQATLKAEAAAKLAQERLLTAEIQKQSAAIRQQQLLARGAKPPGGPPGAPPSGGMFGGFLRGLGGAMLGASPLAGTIFAAVTSAELLGQTLVKLTEKMKEFIESTGPLQQVKEQFEKLAVTSGRDPAKFLDDLRTATHNVVDDINLYRNANTFMQSGIKATQEDIVKLTAATVGLARAQGRDATQAVQALNRFFLTGRSMTLAYVTGIQRTQLAVQGMGRSVDSATRSTMAFQQALQTITAQFEAIGEPAATFTGALKQLEVAQNRFFEELALGVMKSKGFQDLLTWMGELAKRISDMSEGAGAWGEKIGDAFFVVKEAVDAVVAAFTSMWNITVAIGESIGKIFLPDNVSSEFIQRLTTIKGLFITIAQTLVLLRGFMEDFALRAEYTIKEAAVSAKEAWRVGMDPTKGGYDSAKVAAEQARLHQEFVQKLTGAQSKEYQELTKLQQQLTGGEAGPYKIQFAAPSQVYTEQQQEAAARKLAKVQEQIAITTAKIQLEQTQLRIKKEEELVQLQYETGLSTIQEYLAKKAALEAQDHAATLANLKAEHDAKMHYLDIESRETRELADAKRVQAEEDRKTQLLSIETQQTALGLQIKKDLEEKRLSPEDAATAQAKLDRQAAALRDISERTAANARRMASAEVAEADAKRFEEQKQYQSKVLAEQEKYQAKGRALREQDVRDEVAARQKLADAILQVDKSRIERARQNTENEFQQGTIGAEEYLQTRMQYIQDDYDATAAAAEKKLQANKNSEVAQAQFAQTMAKAAEQREKDLTKLYLDQMDIRTKATEAAFNRVQTLITTQLSFQQKLVDQQYFGGGRPEQTDLIQAQLSLLQSRLAVETKELGMMEKGTEQWTQQYSKIMATREALIQYNQELIKSQDYMSGIAGSLQVMAAAAARFPRGGGRVAAGLGGLAAGLEEQEKYRQRVAMREATMAQGKAAAPVRPEDIYKALQDVSNKTGEKLSDVGSHLREAQDAVDEWRRNMVAGSSALDDAITRTTKALEQELIPAIEKAAGAGKAPGAGTGRPRIPFAGPEGELEGPPTLEGPLGTATATDLMKTLPDMLTGGGAEGNVGAQAQAAAVGLSSLTEISKSLEKSFTDLVSKSFGSDGLIGAFKSMAQGGSDASEKLSNFVDTVSQVAGSVGGLMQAAKGTGGPFAAGMAGLTSGMQLGMTVGGPWGAAIGAGVGLVMGVFSGKAKKEAEKIAKDITAEFNAVLVGVQQGTVGLGKAVTEEMNLIQQAVTQLSGKKGGRDTLKQMLPAMEQQLLQLQDQQRQVIKSFDQTVEQISAPEAAQAMVSPIQQIISTYQQYVLAGGNVQIANQYLQNSFKNLVTQGLDQLNQSEQDAINNALNYNDLLIQRQELIQNTNQQIQDIMSQGVAVRQMPEGVTKARQIQQLMLQATTQQAQLDEQIAVSKHRLDNEQHIFNLATTRVGLETQLVALQDAQIDKQDASTAMLLKEVAAFSGAVPTNLPTALTMLGLGSLYIPMSAEPGLAPTPPVPTGIREIDLQNQLAYQQALAYYNQQNQLSTSATVASLASTIPGGMQGITVGPVLAPTGGAAQVGGLLDALASNLNGFVQNMASLFGMGSGVGPATTTTAAPGILSTTAPTATHVTGLPGVLAVSTRSGTSTATSSMVASAMTATSSALNDHVTAAQTRLGVEQQITSLSNQRVASETALTQFKMQEINADMARVQAHTNLYNLQTGQGNSATLENHLMAVYQTRSRYGVGGFYGETSNPL